MSRSENNAAKVEVSASYSLNHHCQNESPSCESDGAYSRKISHKPPPDSLTSVSSVVTPKTESNSSKEITPLVKKLIPFNPFNSNLKERLERPIFSPGVFSTVQSPSQDSREFKWTIDDLSKINPAQIEEEFHFEELTDEKVESEMQSSIDKYFAQTHMPSPWDCRLPTSWRSLTEVVSTQSEESMRNDVDPTACSQQISPYSFSLSKLELMPKSRNQSVSTQTDLSLPISLPETVNSALKPYFLDNDFDEINLSANSLRRKLFFQAEDNLLSPMQYFNVQEDSPLISSSHPVTPIITSRSEHTPGCKLTPLDVSPICRIDTNSMCRNNTTCALRIESPFSEIQNTDELVPENSSKINSQTKQNDEECFKVFESPKLVGYIRRNRKRKRSQDTDVSMFCSTFATAHSSKQSARKVSCGELKTVVADNFVASLDNDCAPDDIPIAEKCSYSNSNNPSFKYWEKENEENHIVASTPTKSMSSG